MAISSFLLRMVGYRLEYPFGFSTLKPVLF